jgi:hypothetical protein
LCRVTVPGEAEQMTSIAFRAEGWLALPRGGGR